MSSELLIVHSLRMSRGPSLRIEVEDFRVYKGEVLALLGPNGAGKTSLLLAIAHLIEPEAANITFAGDPRLWSQPLRLRRQIALVLQEPLLVDGTVWDNVTLGLRFRGTKKDQIEELAHKWLKRLGISHLVHRKVNALSGGEARRTSLARALALQTPLLLMDEPFYALDPKAKASLLDELRPVLHDAGVTTLLVTHDRNEAMALADRVAVMINGRIRQIAAPEEVFTAPVDPDVAELVGAVNILSGHVMASSQGITIVQVGSATLEAAAAGHPGERVFVIIRPEAVTLWRGHGLHLPTTARNSLRAKVRAVRPEGPYVTVSLDCEGFGLSALITRPSALELALTPGDDVTASFKATDTHLVRR